MADETEVVPEQLAIALRIEAGGPVLVQAGMPPEYDQGEIQISWTNVPAVIAALQRAQAEAGRG